MSVVNEKQKERSRNFMSLHLDSRCSIVARVTSRVPRMSSNCKSGRRSAKLETSRSFSVLFAVMNSFVSLGHDRDISSKHPELLVKPTHLCIHVGTYLASRLYGNKDFFFCTGKTGDDQ